MDKIIENKPQTKKVTKNKEKAENILEKYSWNEGIDDSSDYTWILLLFLVFGWGDNHTSHELETRLTKLEAKVDVIEKFM